MANLELWFEGGEDSLSVRRFTIRERISELFCLELLARSPNENIDLEAIVGRAASLRLESGYANVTGGNRYWTGICNAMAQVQGEQSGGGTKIESTYSLRIVPRLWLLTQRTNYRIFQHISIPDIIDQLLAPWSIELDWHIDRGAYPKLEYKVQYGESDYRFMLRLLEEAGIVYTFPDDDGAGSRLALWDRIHTEAPRSAPPITYVDNPNEAAEQEHITKVRLSCEVRPGAYTIRDYDFRNPPFALFGEAAPKALEPEDQYEQYHHQPGACLAETDGGGSTPVADDRGTARYLQSYGNELATRSLEGLRADRRAVAFETNVVDLWPGILFHIDHHPHAELSSSTKLLVTELTLAGTPYEKWEVAGKAVFTDVPHRPLIGQTAKPQVSGVQSATVVGPGGDEIHTDEFGRVRVQFPWDRLGQSDDGSSCWVRVSQGWAGTGYGLINLPRIGQEVLVDFLGGDPDQPMIVGRVFNATQQVPYPLPKHKTRSTWKSNSSLGGGGFNELMFEDLKGKELVYLQAEKNLRKPVKNDETMTIGRDRKKLVKNDELETTKRHRVEVTGGNRTEITGGNRATAIEKSRDHQVGGDELLRTNGSRQRYIAKDQDFVVKGSRRERVEGDVHLHIKGDRAQKIDKGQSLWIVGDQQEKIGKKHAVSADKEMHLKSGEAIVVEAGQDLTIKGPGGFIRIDSVGVTIKGNVVKVNCCGGSAGDGSGSEPQEPEDAAEAEPPVLVPPAVDDVAAHNFGTEHPDR